MPRFATVYRHFDAAGDLLYVGCSINPFMRLRSHEWSASWAQEIATVTIERFDTEEAAYAAELTAIEAEKPRHNKWPRKKAVRPVGPPRRFDPPDDLVSRLRAIWLDGNRSERDRLQAIADVYAPTTRGVLNNRFGWPSRPKPIE